jgi:hypothetical protein
VARILTLFVITFAFYAQAPSTIEGVVRDSTSGAPMADVTVYLSQGHIDSVFAVTDSQGQFTLETKETGRLRVYPSKNGFIYARPGQKRAPAQPGVWVQLSVGDHVKGLELSMAKPAVISGRILDVNGNPIVGNAGSVGLMRYTYRDDGTRELGWVPGIVFPGAGGSFVRMNDRGEFRLYDLPPGEYYLSVSGGGGAIGSSRSYYYPGVTDETKAVPISVSSGDDIKLGTLSLPLREKGVEMRLHAKGEPAPQTSTQRVYIGTGLVVMPAKSDEIVLPVAPGHYDIVVARQTFDRNTNVYASATLDIGVNGLEQEIVLKPEARVSGSVLIENETGDRSPAPSTILCRIHSRYGSENCVGSQVVPGLHQFDLQGTPPDMYLQSAKIGDRDVLAGELNITGDTTLEVILATPGAIVDGIVRTTDGNVLADSAVVLVPDSPYDKVLARYRSVITDSNGKYEIHGIAPGSYQLYAWSELEGFAYRNAEFMKEFGASA